MKNLIKLVMVVILTIIIGIDSKISANQLTFSVEPVLPNNQIDDKSGFFNILLQPGQEQKLVLKYTNNTQKRLTVNSLASSAKTNGNGVVDYSAPTIKNDPTLKYDISKLIRLPRNITLDAGESKKVIVKVTMPSDKFSGIIAGGLTFNDAEQNAKNQSSKSDNVAIKNVYSLQIGILMRQSTESAFSDSQIQETGLKLNDVKAGQLNYRNVIYANLQNPLSNYINQMVIHAEISKVNSSKVLYSISKGSMQMAPNTNFNFPIPLGSGVRMKSGRYNLKLAVYSLQDNSGQFKTNVLNNKIQSFRYRWEFNKVFVITGHQAKRYNKADITITKFNWYFLILLSIAILVLIALILFLYILKRLHDEKKVSIEEEVLDLDNKLTKVVRTVTMKEYLQMVKNGEKVNLVNKKS